MLHVIKEEAVSDAVGIGQATDIPCRAVGRQFFQQIIEPVAGHAGIGEIPYRMDPLLDQGFPPALRRELSSRDGLGAAEMIEVPVDPVRPPIDGGIGRLVVRDRVQRKNVDPEARVLLLGIDPGHQRPDEGFLRVAEPGEIQPTVVVGFRGIDLHALRLEFLDEPLVIRPEHHDVDVVVPGDEALVPHGAEERAISERIADVMLRAEAVQGLEKQEALRLDFRKGQQFHGSDNGFGRKYTK